MTPAVFQGDVDGCPEVVLRGGTIVDGSGAPAVRGDIGIRGDRIVAVAPDLGDVESARHVDASGCIVAPGFIDIHSHSDLTLVIDPLAESAVAQGVTTELVGNCGHGCAPDGRSVDERHDREDSVGCLVSQTAIPRPGRRITCPDRSAANRPSLNAIWPFTNT